MKLDIGGQYTVSRKGHQVIIESNDVQFSLDVAQVPELLMKLGYALNEDPDHDLNTSMFEKYLEGKWEDL